MDTRGQRSHLTITAGPDVIVGAFDRSDLTTELITDHLTVSTQSPQLGQLLGASGDVERVGRELVRGVRTTHYRATIDLRRYPQLAPAAERAAARWAIEQIIEETGASTVPVDVWIGPDRLVRRLTQKLTLTAHGGPSATEQTFELYDFGAKVAIPLPGADEVADVTDLAVAGGGGTATRGP